jgi:FtsZ-interacting cell division protein ZipA
VTELQYGLIGLGALAIAGVVAYNKWQENRHRKVAESVLRPEHDDVLLKPAAKKPAPAVDHEVQRVEPVFAPQIEENDRPTAVATESPLPWADAPVTVPEFAPRIVDEPLREIPSAPMQEPVVEPFVETEVEPLPVLSSPALEDELPEPQALPAELLDPRLEFIVTMELVEPVSSRQILQSQRDVLQRLSRPVHFVAFNERSREWVRLRSDTEILVRRLCVGLQLVNRLGPVSDGDVAIFSGAMQALADELMAVADMPSTRVLDQAAEIDRFCAAVDLEIGLNLVSRGLPFPGTKIRALAEAAGMVLGLDGMFTRHDDDGHPLFSLQNYESAAFSAETLRTMSTHGLTFLLDVPRVEHGERVFQQMVELARRFGETLQGSLVDDNRQPLGDAQLEHIRREFIGKPQATMQSFGMPAGSPQALRLFS